MEIIGTLFFFISGGILGSFLNALTFRHNTGLTMWGRSVCFSCNTTLRWYDLVPVASFLMLGGRCRYCESSVSPQYPIVELTLAVLFALTFLTAETTVELFFFLAATFLLTTIAVYDVRHTIIPNEFVYPFIVLALVYLVVPLVHGGNIRVTILLSGIGAFLFFAALWLFSGGRAMGLGDAKLALGIVWLLGLAGGVSALAIGFWVGAIVGVLGLLLGKVKKRGVRLWGYKLALKSEIPFAPFLIFGFFLAYYLDLSIFF